MRCRLANEIPEAAAGYKEWLHSVHRYSAHVASAFSRDQDAEETAAFWNELWAPMNERFGPFVHARLESLCNLPPTRPVLVHHIARFLARRAGGGAKVALLVLDGLSLSQWRIVRRELERTVPALCISEDACFSMVPTWGKSRTRSKQDAPTQLPPVDPFRTRCLRHERSNHRDPRRHQPG